MLADRSPARTVAVLWVATVLAVGCGRPHDKQWRADSAYHAKLASWLRDSAVIDSVSRTIDASEMIAAYDAMVTAPNPLLLQPRVLCEHVRLAWDYGSLPTDAVAERARDSVMRRRGRDAFGEAFRRTPERAVVEGPDNHCRGTRERPLERVGQTSLEFKYSRPVPP
jgi:hypothetical protein